MKIANVLIDGKVVLAPLAGYTNKVYRLINKRMGAALVYSEMVSAKGLLYDNYRTWDLVDIDPEEHPIALQIFGSNLSDMEEAAKVLSHNTKADFIDINMGCPVLKVLKQNAGVYLMQDPSKVYALTKAVVRGSRIPVSVKIRAGWDHDSINCDKVAYEIERAGASAITIHGRTKTDLYRGEVNLDYIKMVKEAVNIPVIANGDIRSGADALRMLEYTKADMVMIGRGSLGNPWLIEEVNACLQGLPYHPPQISEKITMMLYHLEELIKLKGEKVALLEMRSIGAWYMKDLPMVKLFRHALVNVKTKNEFLQVLNEYQKNINMEQ